MARNYTKAEKEAKIETFLNALEDTHMVTAACKRAGIPRKTLMEWRRADPELEAQVQEVKDANKEWVEGCLLQQIDRGSVAAMCFYLKCQAGWREKPRQVELSAPEAINVKAAIEEIRETLAQPEVSDGK